MRPIKFRAWDFYKKKMFPVKGLRIIAETGAWEVWDGEYIIAPFLVQIMQFTGFSDKDGREIYEGDIVGDLGFVSYESGYFCIKGVNKLLHKFASNIEVIGNIYENGDLLNGTTQ